jgi:hypothetical protein
MAMHLPTLHCDDKWLKWRDVYTGDCIVHSAARWSSIVLARLLETSDGMAMLDDKNNMGETPILVAVRYGNIESIRLLVSKGTHKYCNIWYGEVNDFYHGPQHVCPVKSAIGNRNREVAIALLTSRPNLEERCRFLEQHKHLPLNEYIGCINVRCARAYQAIGTALFIFKKRVGKDVFQFLLKPMLRNQWERHRYDAVWNI